MELTDKYMISDSIAHAVHFVQVGDKESARNYASLAAWRVDHYQSWLTDSEWAFIQSCLKPHKRRRRN